MNETNPEERPALKKEIRELRAKIGAALGAKQSAEVKKLRRRVRKLKARTRKLAAAAKPAQAAATS
jgi:hypothetical protein